MMGTAAEEQIRGAFNGAPQVEPAPLPQPEEPTIKDAALHGVVGEYVRLIEKRTESHRAALVSLMLGGVGNIFGRGSWFEVEDTRHHPNLFIAAVGKPGIGRKGTAQARVNRPLALAAPDWLSVHKDGIESGEVIIHLGQGEGPEGRSLCAKLSWTRRG